MTAVQDFCLCGAVVHRWLQQTFKPAFKDALFQEYAEPDSSTYSDPRLVETLSFHAVNGKRLRSSVEFLEDDECQWTLAALSVSLEAVRILTYYWLSCIGKSLLAGERPALFALLDPRFSVLTQAMQHLGALLTNERGDGRLSLIWQHHAHASFGDWCAAQQRRCRKLRRMLMLGAGWIFRRHVMYIHSDSLQIMICADDQAHRTTLQRFLDFWDMKHYCCLPPGLCRDLKKAGVTSQDLIDPASGLRPLLRYIASTLQLSIADMESMHSQNRGLAGSSFSSIVSKYVNAEARRVQAEANQLQNGKDYSHSPTEEASRNSCTLGGIKVVDKTKHTPTPKGMSAFELLGSTGWKCGGARMTRSILVTRPHGMKPRKPLLLWTCQKGNSMSECRSNPRQGRRLRGSS